MAQDLQQGRDVRGVGEGNVGHHGGPLGGHVPRSYGEDETLRRTGIETKPFVRFPQLRHTLVLMLHKIRKPQKKQRPSHLLYGSLRILMLELWATAPPAGQHLVGHLCNTDDSASLKIKKKHSRRCKRTCYTADFCDKR